MEENKIKIYNEYKDILNYLKNQGFKLTISNISKEIDRRGLQNLFVTLKGYDLRRRIDLIDELCDTFESLDKNKVISIVLKSKQLI